MARYELQDGKSAKFWEIILEGDSFEVCYGRIGTNGRKESKVFPDEATAQKEHDKLVASKVRKGYKAVASVERTPEPPAPDSNPELEAALHADPFATDAWAVYGDWLQSKGQPAGEVIALEAALENASSAEKKALKRKIDQIITDHRAAWLGPELIEGLSKSNHDGPAVSLEWKHGFVWSAKVRAFYDYDGPSVELMLKALLKSPAARFIYEIRVGLPDVDGETAFQREILALAKSGKHPSVRKVVIGDFEFPDETEISWTEVGNVEKLYPVFPNLERLEVQGGDIELGRLRHPNLKSLAIRTGGLSGNATRSIASAQLPALESLEVWFGDEGYGGEASAELIEPLLTGKGVPKLKHLGLKNSEFADDLPALVAGSPLLAQLESLDLSMGIMTGEGAQVLLTNADAFKHLSTLNLDENVLQEGVIGQLKAAFGRKLSVDDQKEYDEDYLYVSVGE